MFTRTKKNVAQVALVGAMVAATGGLVGPGVTASASPQDAGTETHLASVGPFPGLWLDNIVCMTLDQNYPGCPGYGEGGPIA